MLLTFRFVLVSILVQRKFTTDRYVVYKWSGCKFTADRYAVYKGWVVSLVLRRKARDFFHISTERMEQMKETDLIIIALKIQIQEFIG